MKPKIGYASLRRYRVTLPGACYFLTLCTDQKASGLTTREIAQAITSELNALDDDMRAFSPDAMLSTSRAQARWPTTPDAPHIFLRAWVILSDHIHVFFRANQTLSVGQIVARLKAKTGRALRSKKLRWQGNFYERRLRFDDSVEDVLRYMFLNPYRAKLVKPNESYRYFWICPDDATWFEPTLNQSTSFPDWLA